MTAATITFGLSFYWQGVLIAAGIAAIATLGLQVTLASGQFSVMHAALMGAAAYATGLGAIELGMGFWTTLVCGAALGAVLGALAGGLVLRLGGLLLGIATLAMGQAMSVVVNNIEYVGGPAGYYGVPLRTTLVSVGVVLVVALLVVLQLKNSRLGFALLATGRDPLVAASLGVRTTQVRVGAFAFGGLLAGAAGALNAQYVGLVMPTDLGFAAEVELIVYVIIGGVTTPWGALLGAFGITIISEQLRFADLDRLWLLGLVLTFVALTRPNGVLVRYNVGRPWRESLVDALPRPLRTRWRRGAAQADLEMEAGL
jgi:branched-chain amino acid transport system permease protein